MTTNKIAWIDIETTGLDEHDCHILEFGLIITDKNLNELEVYSSVADAHDKILANMNQWCRDTHTASGLLAEVYKSEKTVYHIEREVLGILSQHFGAEKPVIAGNSIHFDRKFIRKYMGHLEKLLHYRMIDVSSFKEAFRIMHDYKYEPLNSAEPKHRVLDDLRHSIAEMKDYKEIISEII